MNGQKFNLHTHIMHCGHASGLDLQYVESATEAGIELLGFSDHIPYIGVNRPSDRMVLENYSSYIMIKSK